MWSLLEEDFNVVSESNGARERGCDSAKGSPMVRTGPSALRTARLRALVGHAALGCRPDEPHVLREHTARGLGRRRSPRLPSSRQFVIADIDSQLTRRGVDGDAIAVAHERDRTSLLRFWRDV